MAAHLFLGVTKPVMIGHGISHAKAFKNMILVAQKMIEKDVLGIDERRIAIIIAAGELLPLYI